MVDIYQTARRPGDFLARYSIVVVVNKAFVNKTVSKQPIIHSTHPFFPLNTFLQRRQSTQGLYAKTMDYTSMRVSSHDIHYVNGTLCAINGKRRYTKVKVESMC